MAPSSSEAFGSSGNIAGAIFNEDEESVAATAQQQHLSTLTTTTTMSMMTAMMMNQSQNQSSCEDMNAFLWAERRELSTRPPVMAMFAALYAIIICLGLLGNACVLVAIARVRSLQTVPNMFIFSLSCSDMLVCCISATITPITAFRKDWIFGQFLCSFAPFIAGVSLCFSTFTLAAISVDRFLLILFPTRKAFSHGQALVIILVICLLASGFSLPMLFMQKLRPVGNYCGHFCFEEWGENLSTRRIYGTLMLTVQFIIPLALIIFCYTAISVRLGKSVNLRAAKKQRGGSAGSGTGDWQVPVSAQRNAATKRRQRTNRMFIAMSLAFSLSWGWSVLYNLLRDYDGLPELVREQEFFFGILTHCIAMSSTVWNPVLYALLNLQLRAAFLQLVPQCLRQGLSAGCGFLCCCCADPQKKASSSNGHQRQNSVEQSRLLGTVRIDRNGLTRSEETNRKLLSCFINSSGSVESSTSDQQQRQPQNVATNGEGRKADLLENGTVVERLPQATRRNSSGAHRYGSCGTELLEEQTTWVGPLGLVMDTDGVGDPEETDETV